MSNTIKYLDYSGLSKYHDELVTRLADLEYDPERMFEDKADLFSLQKWGANKYGRVAGLKAGLIITVENKLWQLDDPETFMGILSSSQPVGEKVLIPAEDLGWKIVGSSVDFNVNDHVLQLTK